MSVLDEDYYEDDDEEDPDALKDPIYQIDLQVGLLWTLRTFIWCLFFSADWGFVLCHFHVP